MHVVREHLELFDESAAELDAPPPRSSSVLSAALAASRLRTVLGFEGRLQQLNQLWAEHAGSSEMYEVVAETLKQYISRCDTLARRLVLSCSGRGERYAT